MSKLENIVKSIPHKPGIYKYLDSEGNIIYVGKAKDLSKRVRSYFRKNKDHGPKTRVMVAQIHDIQYTVVDSELEAIMLETNLIKEIRPKYNILMKDDKNFVYIKITTNEQFPKIYLVRKLAKDKATYIGPKTSGFDIKNTARLISSLLPFPKCQLNIETIKTTKASSYQKAKPLCIVSTLDPDHTPCIAKLEEQEYREVIDKIIQFFKGKHSDLAKHIQAKMQELATNKEYEKAANLRDKLISLEKIIEQQKISGPTQESLDVIDIIYSNNQYFANLFQIRAGHLISQNNFILPSSGLTEGITTEMQEVFTTFLQQYYSETADFPKEILIPEILENTPDLEQWISSLTTHQVKINVPQIGKKHQLIALATKNAVQYSKLMKVKWMSNQAHSSEKTLPDLKALLKLPKLPRRIECYDISHLQGENTIGSMVVFEKGLPLKSDYRYFNLRGLGGKIDDFASMQEILTRRLKYLNVLPKTYSAKKKGDMFQLVEKSSQEVIFELKTVIEEDHIIINELPKINQQNLYLFEAFFSNFIQKTKKKRYLIKETAPANISILYNLGFIEIENPSYNLGFYTNQRAVDKSFKKKPDLIIIDGGKGQLSAALKAKELFNLDIPFISLAEKFEEIFTETGDYILLPKTSPVLHLLQQVRDEAHRFAITKNRKDRIKKMLNKK